MRLAITIRELKAKKESKSAWDDNEQRLFTVFKM